MFYRYNAGLILSLFAIWLEVFVLILVQNCSSLFKELKPWKWELADLETWDKKSPRQLIFPSLDLSSTWTNIQTHTHTDIRQLGWQKKERDLISWHFSQQPALAVAGREAASARCAIKKKKPKYDSNDPIGKKGGKRGSFWAAKLRKIISLAYKCFVGLRSKQEFFLRLAFCYCQHFQCYLCQRLLFSQRKGTSGNYTFANCQFNWPPNDMEWNERLTLPTYRYIAQFFFTFLFDPSWSSRRK